MLSAVGTMESSMSKAGLDNRHRNHDGEISGKYGNTLVRTLRKIYGQGSAAGYPETTQLPRSRDASFKAQDRSCSGIKAPTCRTGAEVKAPK